MKEDFGFTLIILIIFASITISKYTDSLENKEAIKAGLEQCVIKDKTIWSKDCEKTLKIYKIKD